MTSPAAAATPAAPPITADLVATVYAARVHRFAAMVARGDQDAEDLAQDALVRILRHADRYDPARGSVEGWLWRVVVNAATDAGRAAGRRRFLRERLARHAVEAPSNIEDAALQRIDNQELLAAVRRLPRRGRTLIALRYGAGLAYADIGGQLGISTQAAVMATRRALAALRRSLESS